MVAKPFNKRPSLPQVSDMTDSKDEILKASKKPSGNSKPKVDPATKPRQFYFGQDPGVSESNHYNSSSSQTTAIEKVRNNEAVSHPKNILVNPGYMIKNYVDQTGKSGKPSFKFGDTPPTKHRSRHDNEVPPERPPLPAKPDLVPEPPVRPFINYAKPKSQQSDLKKNKIPEKERTQDEVNREFEKQLLSGKNRLKSYESQSNGYSRDETDSGISIVHSPSPPLPPPPPPPEFSNETNEVVSYLTMVNKKNKSSIPEAPKLRDGNKSAAGKRIIPPKSSPNSMNGDTGKGKEDFLKEIRNFGGVGALRKACCNTF